MQSQTPPLIAVIGSDGSGKSTVCEHLIKHVSKYGPATRVHLGKQAGNVERSLVKLPLIGRYLSKAIKRNKISGAKKLPGPLPGLVIMCFVLRRLWRFRHMLACRRRGLIVLTDRFPQIEIPGTYDGPVFPDCIPGGRLVSWMAREEHKAFHWMARQKPDLVIRLNVDLKIACARKPDHKETALARKIAVTPLLTFGGARLVDIDANQPLPLVLAAAQQAVSALMEECGYPAITAEKK